MEPHLVLDRRPEAAALLRPDVDDRRPGQRERRTERVGQRRQVVPRHDPDVGDPEVLEQLARLGEAHDRRAQPARPLEQARPDHGDLLDRPVIGALAVAPRARQLDLREVLGDRPDRRADRHLVVVEHDEHLGLALADVVQGLERQAAHQRGIPDDDRDAFHPMAQVARLGEALGDRQPRPGVPAIEHVVRRFAPPREAADAVERAQCPEPCQASGEQLVRVGLVAGVPHDPVARRLQQPVQRDRQLHDAERRPEVAARLGDGPDDGLADLGGEPGELDVRQAAQVGGPLEVGKDGHVAVGSDGFGAGAAGLVADGSAVSRVAAGRRVGHSRWHRDCKPVRQVACFATGAGANAAVLYRRSPEGGP